jgi:putative FmdB family regulatory protein
MPIYEYACESCGTKFEKLVRRSEDVKECPSCASTKLAQQWSTFAARANGIAKDAAPAGRCGGGMCPTPEACGLN